MPSSLHASISAYLVALTVLLGVVVEDATSQVVLPLHRSTSRDLRSSSQDELKQWAARERLRINGKYGRQREREGRGVLKRQDYGESSYSSTKKTTEEYSSTWESSTYYQETSSTYYQETSSTYYQQTSSKRSTYTYEASTYSDTSHSYSFSPSPSTRTVTVIVPNTTLSTSTPISTRTVTVIVPNTTLSTSTPIPTRTVTVIVPNTTLSTSTPTPTTAPLLPTAPTLGYANLTNYQSDLEYYAPIYVGSPPQVFNVILDTGSADFWLVDTNCTSQDCAQVATFAANISTSAVANNTDFSIHYGMASQGTASGSIWNDTIALAGHNLMNQSFALCDTVSTQLIGGNESGIMGLGWPSLSASSATPFWLNLMNQDTTSFDFPGFSFYLTRSSPSINASNSTNVTQDAFGGLFTLGTLSNVSYIPPINYVDIPAGNESYWVIPLTAISLNGTNLANMGTPNVAIDTGTTLIGGPANIVQSLYEQIGGAFALDGEYEGYYTYPCNASASIAFTFGNVEKQTYNMSSFDLNLGVFEDDQCLGAFFDLDLSSGSAAVISWVIGGAFLKNVYSVYRYYPVASVGFAELSPILFAATDDLNRTSPSPLTTSALFPPGIIGAPSGSVNGSTISGSALTPTNTPAFAHFAAADDLSLVHSTALPKAKASSGTRLRLSREKAILAVLAMLSLGAWTLNVQL
ncbi:MAG: hypothetical protein CYPHOPRED_003473 [Cyphobasidiales sp. Tagirdzhanova-0007]|nr:MAG: hypothetical protein CYPHOPRED_003473 [Cyphobasidiales sp. Tagirdzhanova-0007]